MSYSRWGSSIWYTYWCSQLDETENRETAIFEICDFFGGATYTAKQLRNRLSECLDDVREKYKDQDISELDIKELETYMMRFLEDVDEEYPQNK